MAFIIPRLRQQFFRLGNPFLTRPAGVVRVMQRHAADIRLTDQPGRALALAKHFSGNDIFINAIFSARRTRASLNGGRVVLNS